MRTKNAQANAITSGIAKIAQRRKLGYLDIGGDREPVGMVGEPPDAIRLPQPGTRFRRPWTQAPNSSFRSPLIPFLSPPPNSLRPWGIAWIRLRAGLL
jgi:hypothetical protein